MATSVDEDDEYEYDDESEAVDDDDDDQNRDLNNTQDDDEEDEDDDYPVEEDDDDMMVNDTNTSMEWESAENPNAAPMGGRKGDGIRMLPSDALLPEMKRRLKDVTEVLDVPTSAAIVLLGAYNWSKELLLEKYYNDPDALLKECGVYYRCNPIVKKPAPKTRSSKSNSCCPICYEDGVKMWSMPCGHEFCQDCWHDFCANAIEEGPVCVRTTCPESKCTEVIAEEEVAIAVPELLSKYQSYQLRSFVDSNALTRWCPGKGCERVACASSATALELVHNVAHCDACLTNFCIICGDEPHQPCGCKDLQLWRDKCRNESETANWILANTKSCPKCVSRIEKNQGCNHMTCSRCRYEFCWICMGDWNEHGSNTGGYYKCNKFDANSSGDDQTDAARAKRELDRYLHFYKRYHAHAEAQDFAKKQLKETEARMVLLQESSENAKWSDVEFLKTANEQLVECRRVLKYTYVFAYYMSGKQAMQRERFEHHQEMLEKFTENLSELSEKPLAEMDRTDVVNQTRVVDRFMKNILKYVEDGMEDL